MPRIHWLGAGLSAVPGIRRLAAQNRALVLWNRTLQKAERALEGIEGEAQARQLDWDHLLSEVTVGDVLVSMLPADMHLQVAEICIGNQAHFVSSSYISPQMSALADRVAEAGLRFVNEVGLDPGIDHLMAHALVNEYQQGPQFDPAQRHHFRSYCGGLSKIPNDFKYKFSWSPLGVLRALTSQATWLEQGEVKTTNRPWAETRAYTVQLPEGEETFEAYPNRNSLPFMSEYGFGDDWNVQEFVRGTLRLGGWSEAWKDIFELIDSTAGEERDRQLAAKSEELWKAHRLEKDDADRVVLSVELEVRDGNQTVWHRKYVLDEIGDERGTAMSRLVSLPVSLAVEAVLDGKIEHGVSAAPNDKNIVHDWFAELEALGERIERVELV